MIRTLLTLTITFTLALASANCDVSQNFCCLSGFSCPATSNSFAVGSTTFSLGDLNVISFNDITINHGDVQGRVATRNNFYGVNGISVGDTITDDKPYSLVVGGNLVWSDTGNVFPVQQGVFAGNTGAVAPADIVSRIVGSCNNTGCLNSVFDQLLAYYSQFSSTLSNTANNVDVTITAGIATLSCQSSSANAYYYRFDPAQFSQVIGYGISANCNPSASFIINVVGSGDVIFGGNSINTTGAYVIFNVGPSANIVIGSSVYGNIVAPVSNINMNGGTIYGNVIAGNFSNLIQVNTLTSCPTASSTPNGQCVNPTSGTPTASTTASSPASTTGADSNNGFSTDTAINGQNTGSNGGNSSSAFTITVSVFAAIVAIALL